MLTTNVRINKCFEIDKYFGKVVFKLELSDARRGASLISLSKKKQSETGLKKILTFTPHICRVFLSNKNCKETFRK